MDLDNGEPISSAQLQQFQHNVASFEAAEWLEDAPEGSGQCHYLDKDGDPGALGVYLAKPTFGPDRSSGNWHLAGYDEMRCDSGIKSCKFQDHP